MRKLFYLVDDNKAEFAKALHQDMARPAQEALGAEITMMLQDIINVVKNVSPATYPLKSSLILGQKMNMSLLTCPST
jgi:acyl-CoA reductase-like NAD-dependent aldehyde dehydrogenase